MFSFDFGTRQQLVTRLTRSSVLCPRATRSSNITRHCIALQSHTHPLASFMVDGGQLTAPKLSINLQHVNFLPEHPKVSAKVCAASEPHTAELRWGCWGCID